MRTIEFDTDEGTWMNLDISPHGETKSVSLPYAIHCPSGDLACRLNLMRKVRSRRHEGNRAV